MATGYRIYSNGGGGGPVDFSAPLASTAGLSYTAGPLGASTDTTFVVRAYDTASGLEQAGSEARTRVVVGPDGTELSGLPNPPHAPAISAAVGGAARVSWAYAPAESWGTPTGFHVYISPGATVDYSSPAASVSYSARWIGYACVLPGPYPDSNHTAGVRSFNATGVEANTVTAVALLGVPTPYAMGPVVATAGPFGP